MPRKDPVTGCMVMTTAEFWKHEAELPGETRNAAEIAEDFYSEMEQDRRQTEEKMKQPAEMLANLVRAVKEWNEADPEMDQIPTPAEVIEVLAFSYDFTYRKETTHAKVKVRTENGQTGVITLDEASYSGSFLDPPDYDVNLNWEPEHA